MDELVNAIIKSYGLIGLFMLAPVVSTVYLWQENKRLNEKMREMGDKYNTQIDSMGQRVVAAQEKRIEDSGKITAQLITMVTETVAASKDTTTALDRVGDMVSMVGGQINALGSQLSGVPAVPPPGPRRHGT